jgi:ectoine hydroxylase-related dioxygenase (phytanoyl-CoA dioxygenase family)
VEHGDLTTPLDRGRHLPHKSGGEATTSSGGIGADRADLGVPRQAHALAGHRDQSAVLVTPADVAAELDGSRQEWAGPGELDQVEHVLHVVVAEHGEVRVGRFDRRADDHLLGVELERHLPPGRELDRWPRHDRETVGAHESAEGLPIDGVGFVGYRGERRHVGPVAARATLSLREVRVRARERVPDRVVQGMHVRDPVTVVQTVDLDFHLARIDADGYTIVEDAIEPALVTRLRDTIRRLEGELDLRPRETAAEGIATLRMYNLLAKDPVFQAMPVHAAVLPIVEALLDRGCLLSGLTAIDIGPGEQAQPMHGDDIVMSRHLQLPHAPMMVTSMWALTDFTDANGGTRFVPGSHRFPVSADAPGALDGVEVDSLEMPAGSVMVFHGSLWHGGGPNTTADEWRLGVNVQYCPGFVRQQQNPYLGIPPEVAATFDDRLLTLLGYRLYKGIMGHVDGRSPGEVVFGERFAETAYRDAERRRSERPATTG